MIPVRTYELPYTTSRIPRPPVPPTLAPAESRALARLDDYSYNKLAKLIKRAEYRQRKRGQRRKGRHVGGGCGGHGGDRTREGRRGGEYDIGGLFSKLVT